MKGSSGFVLGFFIGITLTVFAIMYFGSWYEPSISTPIIVFLILLIIVPVQAFAIDPHILVKDVTTTQVQYPLQVKNINGSTVFYVSGSGSLGGAVLASMNQLPSTTADRVIVSSGSGQFSASAITTTLLNYLTGVSSDIQTQFSGKQNIVTGVSDTEIGFLDGVLSDIQSQFTGKQTTVLTDGNILVGSSGGIATSVNPTGDVDISNTGVFSIPNIHNIANVTETGCASGQILKVNSTGQFACNADDTFLTKKLSETDKLIKSIQGKLKENVEKTVEKVKEFQKSKPVEKAVEKVKNIFDWLKKR